MFYRYTLIGFVLVLIWIISIYFRMFDKKIKRYSLFIGYLLIFWMIDGMYKRYTKGLLCDIMWYLYYIPLIFVPTCYYMASKYLVNKQNKVIKHVFYSISLVLFLMVLTNNIHRFVFSVPDDNGKYKWEFGYYIVCIWIFYLFISATLNLVIDRMKTIKNYKAFLPFIPILLGIIYTVLYISGQTFGIFNNIIPVFSIIIIIGIECAIGLDLIPANIAYKTKFINSNLHIAIISNNLEYIYQTKYKMNIPQNILDDIKKGMVKNDYYIDEIDKLYTVKNINGGYIITQKDYSVINNLKKKLQKQNDELKRQENILKKEEKIKKELYEIEINKKILKDLENAIDEKRKKIDETLNNIGKDEKIKLAMVKLWISYCKSISGIIISNYNNENYDESKIKLVFNELIEDAKTLSIQGALNIKPVNITSSVFFSIYEIAFYIIENISNTQVFFVIFEENDEIVIKTVIGKNIAGLKEKIEEKNIINIKNIYETNIDDETNIKVVLEK